MQKISWRFGADLGANSLGWAAIELDDHNNPVGILAAGSRIYSDGRDPKSGASLAVDRRDARAMRRRRDRFKQRQQALIKYLTLDGLFPADATEREKLKALDPFELRARALDEALPLNHIGRAFFHLNQRRGFKSNRKADKPDDDSGKVKIGIDRLRDKIGEIGARTFGEFLHLRRKSATDRSHIPSVRTRLRPESGEGAKGDGYDFYPGRALIDEEFTEIWEAQAPHHPDVLTPDVYERLHEIVFHQRPLRAPKIGKCTLVPTEERLAKAHPLFQRRRLLEEINALMIVRPGEKAVRLTPEERNLLLLKLKDRAKVPFATLRKVLKLDPDARFNKESENRTDLKGDEVSALMGAKTRFGDRWLHLSVDEQWAVLNRLSEIESDEEVSAFRHWLETAYGLTAEQSKSVVGARPPQGYGRTGLTATTAIIEALMHARTPAGRKPEAGQIEAGRVVVYSEAVAIAGYDHSDFRTGEVLDELPYYGVTLERHIMPGTAEPSDPEELRVGRITNPTVHIGLNQLRRVVNRLIKTYGMPAEIALELARDLKLNEEEKKKANLTNRDNRIAAEKRSQKLLGVDRDGNQIGDKIADDTGANRALLRLWEELNPGNCLDRRCIYSGKQISIDMLFSDAVEVDHILPFAATLDDSNGNKIVCLREANRIKRKRSPYEARLDLERKFGPDAAWEEISARAANLDRGKRRKFEPDAMERAATEGDFLARHLNDTKYLSRLAREYLSALYPGEGEGSSKVWVSPGRLTALVRRKLGLDRGVLSNDNLLPQMDDKAKNRLDHRHHAIDAIVIALISRSYLQNAQHLSGTIGEDARQRVEFPQLWDGFHNDVRDAVNAIVVSHRADHGTASKTGRPRDADATAGRLHNETAYGFTGERDSRGNNIVVHRVLLSTLKKATDIERVRDAELRAALYRFTEGMEGKAFEQAIGEFHELGPLAFRDIRRVRVVEPLTLIPIRDRNGRIYKGYKGDSNYRYDVWEMPDGAWVTSWTDGNGQRFSSVVSMFDAHQPTDQPRPHPAARKVLSLHQNDLLAVERSGEERKLMRVVKFGQNGQVTLAEPQEAGDLKRRDAASAGEDGFKYFSPTAGGLKKARARQIRIDELGRISDPGFPARTARRRTRT